MKNNFTFIRDLYCEERNGKFSSKKFWGHLIMLLVCVSYVLDGLHFYKINENLFNSMLIAGGYLLGITIIKNVLTNNKSNIKNEEQK